MKINKKNIVLATVSALLLAGCASTNHEDLDAWMKEKDTSLKGRIDPLPPAKTFSPLAFSAQEDPFVKKPTMTMIETDKNKFAPDPDRRKDPLEFYQLDALKMTGSLLKDKKFHAIIKASDNIVHYVTVGNYMGSNFGRIIKLDESQIILDERIREGDEWKQKETQVLLDDGEARR